MAAGPLDEATITESLSSERDPSPDPSGQMPGLRTWYSYYGQPASDPEYDSTSSPQISCIAWLLPDGASRYFAYDYLFGNPSVVNDNRESITLSDGSLGARTNWFGYWSNWIDVVSVRTLAGQYWHLGYNGNHEVTAVTNSLNQAATLTYDPGR